MLRLSGGFLFGLFKIYDVKEKIRLIRLLRVVIVDIVTFLFGSDVARTNKEIKPLFVVSFVNTSFFIYCTFYNFLSFPNCNIVTRRKKSLICPNHQFIYYYVGIGFV